MKLAIISDTHDNWDLFAHAVEVANAEGCSHLLFAGDLVAPPGIEVMKKFNGEVKFVWGNNEGEKVGITRKMDALDNFEMCGDVFEGEIDGIKTFMNHYPKFAELAAQSGRYDLVIFGHTHEYVCEQIGSCILLNPGSIHLPASGTPSFAIFDTVTKSVTKRELGNAN